MKLTFAPDTLCNQPSHTLRSTAVPLDDRVLFACSVHACVALFILLAGGIDLHGDNNDTARAKRLDPKEKADGHLAELGSA